MKMKETDLLTAWQAEAQCAHVHGWDFSHIRGRYQEEDDLPWDYEQLVRRYLRPDSRILDMDTGGGEFLLSLHHPYSLTSATEAYLPNVALCRETLFPLRIDFHEAAGSGPLPFPDRSFDLVLNRHGDYLPSEIYRVLKPNGIFLTQQVGAENDRDLVSLLLDPVPPLPFPEQYLEIARKKLEDARFAILEAQEAFRPTEINFVYIHPKYSNCSSAEVVCFGLLDLKASLSKMVKQCFLLLRTDVPQEIDFRVSDQSGSGTWVHWSGSPELLSGNFLGSLWRTVNGSCSRPRKFWSRKARLWGPSTGICW